ncbi:MAG: LEA type 2 family protein [Burkholderiaceae bacterium]|nr:LEA type 2 family protein [Burkholderiaceae bacterium]
MALPAALLPAGCETLGTRDPLHVSVAGVESLPGEGLELRFIVKLRIQNPNDAAVEYDGLALNLEVNGRDLASGVSDQKGVVPRFGESVLEVPMTVSAFAALRQALGLAQGAQISELPYALTGKLAGGMFGTVRFSHRGVLTLPR